MYSLLKGACYNQFQLFNSKEEAQALKNIVKQHFAPKLIYRIQQESPLHTGNDIPRGSLRTSKSIPKSTSSFSLLQSTATSQSNIKPIVLKKKEVLLKRIKQSEVEKVKKAVAKARGETEAMNLQMKYTHIPLKLSEQIPVNPFNCGYCIACKHTFNISFYEDGLLVEKEELVDQEKAKNECLTRLRRLKVSNCIFDQFSI